MSCEGLQGAELQVCEAAEVARAAAVAAAKLAEGRDTVASVVTLIDALTALLLPLTLIVLLVKMWPVLRGIFETRKFTIKIAGFELSAQEATDQLRSQIEDLQAKVAALTAHAPVPAVPETTIVPPAPPRPATRRILWVDDQPANNAALIAAFQREGIEIDLAVTTAEGLGRLQAQPEGFAAVIADQGRVEDGKYRSDAGTALVREMRAQGIDLPVALFTSARGVRTGGDALKAGAEIVTSSSTDIRAFVARHTGGVRAD